MASATEQASDEVARVNGIALHRPGEALAEEELRQRACTELLRQAAQRAGLLDAADEATADGVLSVAAARAIDALLERSLVAPEPSEDDCRRHHAAQPARWRRGERLRLRHILFAVTPGVDVTRLRQRAEAALLEVRCRDAAEADRFGEVARTLSNCPSGADGGELGWLEAEGCASEFARQVFGRSEVGVLPRLVHSRHGLHVVEVLQREPGETPPFEAVRGAVAQALQQQASLAALRQWLRVLAGQARIEGVALDAAATPLVQ